MHIVRLCTGTPRLTLKRCAIFLVSAEVGKLGRAAQILGIGTASLSRRIARIEDELGLTLF